jgi:hypothetical protein
LGRGAQAVTAVDHAPALYQTAEQMNTAVDKIAVPVRELEVINVL